MMTDIEMKEIETIVANGKLTLAESVAYYNLFLIKQLDRIIVSAGCESPGTFTIGLVLGILVYDHFMTRFGRKLGASESIIAESEESKEERTLVLMRTWPEYPHQRLIRLIDFAAEKIMYLWAAFIDEVDKIDRGEPSQNSSLDFFLEYVYKNSVDDDAHILRSSGRDFSTALCHAFKVLCKDFFSTPNNSKKGA